MWFMSIESDIHVFICMGFVLVKLFDEWFIIFTHENFILFFILRRICISTWLLMWERNVEYGKTNSLVI